VRYLPLLIRAAPALLLCAMGAGAMPAAEGAPPDGDASSKVGERIYLAGLLPSDKPVQAARRDGPRSEGAIIACVSCHRRSGLGSGEGTIRIPPITSKYLFARTGVQPGRPTLDARAAADGSRAAYDEPALALAIRTGVGRGGRNLNDLMPRYDLDDAAMAGLIAYLKSLPVAPSPGVSDTTLDFAIVVTPDADPTARDGMLAVLEQFVADKNAFLRGGGKPLRSQGQIDYRVTRRWQLHVWNLHGAAQTWEAQLRGRMRAQPVFAMLSGIGGKTWEPVHRFCEAEHVPCLFANVAAPVDAEQDFYSIYLSKGVLLEAELVAARLRGLADNAPPRRLVQVYSSDGAAAAAVKRLGVLAAPDYESVNYALHSGDVAGLAQAVAGTRSGDALMLWLGPADLALLGGSPPAGSAVYVSGVLAGLEHASLSGAWRAAAQMVYPVDLPEGRAVRMNYPLRWFQIRHVPLVAEKIQADTYLACGVVSEALNDMLDNFMRDFLVERIESMISHRQLTGYYPRLGLGPGQRFASKGGYLVKFSAPNGSAITPITDWVIP